jgi:hypothetical protein
MSTLRARFGLQGLEHHGVTLADQPGLVMKGKQLTFFSLSHRPPAGAEAPLAALKTWFAKGIDYARRDEALADLHLYYLDADGRAILSLPFKPQSPPSLKVGDTLHDTVPVTSLRIVRRYEAVGKTGVRFRTKEEIRDVYTALEMFQTAYQMGWGGQFFARDPEARTSIFRHFDPFRSGLLRVEERLTNLTLSVQLFQEATGQQELIAYRPVKTSLESATLDEALAWS